MKDSRQYRLVKLIGHIRLIRHNRKMADEIPDWAAEPFQNFLYRQEELDRILHLAKRGISVLKQVPGVIEALAGLSADAKMTEEHISVKLESALNEAELAKKEETRGFPLLHSQAVVLQWAYLDALVRTFLVSWMTHEPAALKTEAVKKAQKQISDVRTRSDEEKYARILDTIEQNLNTRSLEGIVRFEVLLEQFELSGKVPDEIKKDLLEMFHVRSIIVHNGGIADVHFVEACPWIALNTGEPVSVNKDAFKRYTLATTEYVLALIKRVQSRFS